MSEEVDIALVRSLAKAPARTRIYAVVDRRTKKILENNLKMPEYHQISSGDDLVLDGKVYAVERLAHKPATETTPAFVTLFVTKREG